MLTLSTHPDRLFEGDSFKTWVSSTNTGGYGVGLPQYKYCHQMLIELVCHQIIDLKHSVDPGTLRIAEVEGGGLEVRYQAVTATSRGRGRIFEIVAFVEQMVEEGKTSDQIEKIGTNFLAYPGVAARKDRIEKNAWIAGNSAYAELVWWLILDDWPAKEKVIADAKVWVRTMPVSLHHLILTADFFFGYWLMNRA